MSHSERFDILVLGSGMGGRLLAWHLARAGRRAAVVERRWIGGSCPNVTCLPSNPPLPRPDRPFDRQTRLVAGYPRRPGNPAPGGGGCPRNGGLAL